MVEILKGDDKKVSMLQTRIKIGHVTGLVLLLLSLLLYYW